MLKPLWRNAIPSALVRSVGMVARSRFASTVAVAQRASAAENHGARAGAAADGAAGRSISANRARAAAGVLMLRPGSACGRPPAIPQPGMRSSTLPNCSPASSRSCAARASASGNTVSITGRARPLATSVVGRLEVRARAHRRAEHVELLPPDAVELRRRVRRRSSRRRRRPARRCARPRARSPRSPRRRARRRRRSRVRRSTRFTAARTSPVAWLTVASAPSSRARSSFASLDEVASTCAPSAFAIASAAVATPPPTPQTSTHSSGSQARARDEHPVRRLEDERERRRLLERDPVGERVDVRRRHGDQLGVRARPCARRRR